MLWGAPLFADAVESDGSPGAGKVVIPVPSPRTLTPVAKRKPDATQTQVSSGATGKSVGSPKKKAGLSLTPTVSPTPTTESESTSSEETDLSETSARGRWVPPAVVGREDQILRFTAHAVCEGDGRVGTKGFSIFDFSAIKGFGIDSVTGEGWVRFSKQASSSDRAGTLELRTARATFFEPWIQCTVGRFDLFPHLTPNAFFGSYPTMGLRRVDGFLVILPAFFKFGIRDDKTYTMPPASLSFFYSPTFFPEGAAILDQTQAFALAQARFRVRVGEVQTGLRFNYAKSRETWFAFSSFSGVPAYSAAAEIIYRGGVSATVEYGVQNVCRWRQTNAVSGGLRVVRAATWGPFSVDDLVVEGQWPIARVGSNPFTGGNDLLPALAGLPKAAWYARIKTRLKELIVEFHVTNNQDDFTLGRLVPESVYLPFADRFGPGLEAEGSGTGFRGRSYREPRYLVRVGVEF